MGNAADRSRSKSAVSVKGEPSAGIWPESAVSDPMPRLMGVGNVIGSSVPDRRPLCRPPFSRRIFAFASSAGMPVIRVPNPSSRSKPKPQSAGIWPVNQL